MHPKTGCAFVAFLFLKTDDLQDRPAEAGHKKVKGGWRLVPAMVFRRPPGEALAESSGFSCKIITAAPSRQHMEH
jgi:hypothetical protein